MRVTAVVIRNKVTGKIIDIESICDSDCEVDIWYPSEFVGSIENIRNDLKGWPESYLKDALYGYLTKGGFTIHVSAGHAPTIGDVLVRIETRIIDLSEWEKLPLER